MSPKALKYLRVEHFGVVFSDQENVSALWFLRQDDLCLDSEVFGSALLEHLCKKQMKERPFLCHDERR